MNARSHSLAIAGLVTAGLVIYARAFAIGRYGDDLGFLLPTPIDPLFHFTAPHPHSPWYRPLEAMLHALVQNGFSLAVWPLHAVALALHLVVALLVQAIARDWGADAPEAWLAAIWCLVCQVGVMAVASTDTLSQQCATLGVTAMAWQFHRGLESGGWRALGLGWLAAALALWGKESGVAAVPVALVIAAPHLRGGAGGPRALAAFGGVALLTAGYLACRGAVAAASPELGSRHYGFELGPNILCNLAILWGSALAPVSTVDLVHWMQLGPRWLLAPAMLPALALGIWTLHAWRGRPRLAGLLLLAVVSLLPMLLLHHVSELYAYQALPWLSILLGGGLARLWPVGRGTLVGLLLLAQIGAVQVKLGQMVTTGRRTASYLAQLRPIVQDMPAGGRLILLAERPAEWRYGVFVLPGLRVFMHGLSGLPVVLGRDNVQYLLKEPDEAPPYQAGDRYVGLSADGATVQLRSAPMERRGDS